MGGKKKLKAGPSKTKACAAFKAAGKEIRKLAAADNMLPSVRAQNKALAKKKIEKLCK